jgi:hypothetical protein
LIFPGGFQLHKLNLDPRGQNLLLAAPPGLDPGTSELTVRRSTN